MATIFNRIFGKAPVASSDIWAWESRLSFEHAQVDRQLLKEVVQAGQQADNLAQSFFADSLSIEYATDIPLQREVDLLQRYIYTKQSYTSGLYVRPDIKIEDTDLLIAPFMLFPLIQSAIYSAYFVSEQRPIKYKLHLINNVLQLEVSNRVNPYLQSQSETEYMRFFESRLKFAYPGKHDLLISSNSNVYKAVLRLELSSVKSDYRSD